MEVREEFITLAPSVVLDSIETLFILKILPEARFQCSLDVQLVFELSQIIVLSVAPLRVIPPPFAVVFVGVPTEPIVIFLSSTSNVVELTVVDVP